MGKSKLVYIASPYAGDVKTNVQFAKAACRYAIGQGATPVARICSTRKSLRMASRKNGKPGSGWGCGCWKPAMKYGCAEAVQRREWAWNYPPRKC